MMSAVEMKLNGVSSLSWPDSAGGEPGRRQLVRGLVAVALAWAKAPSMVVKAGMAGVPALGSAGMPRIVPYERRRVNVASG